MTPPSHSILLVALIVVFSATPVLSYPAQTSYCASFNPATTNKVAGYFAATINTAEGLAYYDFSVNLSKYLAGVNGNPSCDLSKGLKYHIHSYWTNSSSTSTYGANSCGASQTSSHYDPTFACSPYSQYVTAPTLLCGKIFRTSPQYHYTCNSTVFGSGKLDNCEVGDLSGKFGPSVGVNKVYGAPGGAVLVDPLPPRVADYRSSKVLITNYTAPWQSIVFHCNDGAVTPPVRLFCAKFTTSLGPCQAQGATFAPLSTSSGSSSPQGFSKSQFGGAIAGASIICILGGALVGVLFMRFQVNKAATSALTTSLNPISDKIPTKSSEI